MPSSISSSNDRLPHACFGRVWVVALAIVTILVGSDEIFWRSMGFVPSVNDDIELWCRARHAVRNDDPGEIILIGASRIQLGIDPTLFAENFSGRRPVQLAVNGSNCIPLLRHFSDDEHFRGTLVCDVSPWTFFTGIIPNEGMQADYVHHYERQSASAAIEQDLRIWMQSHLVFRLPDASLKRLAACIFGGRRPHPGYIVTLPDRSRKADYSKVDFNSLKKVREAVSSTTAFGVSPDQFKVDLESLRQMVEKLQRRGGQVVFVMMPTSGATRRIEEKFPRKLYWDALATRTGAIAIHFADYPQLQFDCPDGGHLDYRSVGDFTKSFAAILKTKLSPPGGNRN